MRGAGVYAAAGRGHYRTGVGADGAGPGRSRYWADARGTDGVTGHGDGHRVSAVFRGAGGSLWRGAPGGGGPVAARRGAGSGGADRRALLRSRTLPFARNADAETVRSLES